MSLYPPQEETQRGAERRAPRRSRRRKPPVRRRTRPGLGFAVVTGILGVVISPIVLLVSIFRPNMRVSRQWMISIVVLTAICVCVAFAGASKIEQWSADAVKVMGAYDSARVRVRDLPFAEKVNFEGLRNGVDPSLLAAVMSQSSGFQTDAVSWRGARGLMQLMPAVWNEFMPEAECLGDHAPPACSEACIFSVDANLRVGAAYLRWLIDANHGDTVAALAAYSAGQPINHGGNGEYGGYGGHSDYVSDGSDGDRDGLGDYGGYREYGGHGEYGDDNGRSDYGEPDGSGGTPSVSPADRPLGYARSIIQAWINYRGEQGRISAAQVVTATAVRALAGWAAVGLLCLLAVWVAIRFPNVGRSSQTDGQASVQQPEEGEECAGGDPYVATAGDARVSGSGDADGAGL